MGGKYNLFHSVAKEDEGKAIKCVMVPVHGSSKQVEQIVSPGCKFCKYIIEVFKNNNSLQCQYSLKLVGYSSATHFISERSAKKENSLSGRSVITINCIFGVLHNSH